MIADAERRHAPQTQIEHLLPVGFHRLAPAFIRDSVLRMDPVQPGAFDHLPQALIRCRIQALGPDTAIEALRKIDAFSFRNGVMQNGQSALYTGSDGVFDLAEGNTQPFRLPLAIADNVEPLFRRYRQGSHHHRQDRLQHQFRFPQSRQVRRTHHRQIAVGTAQGEIHVERAACGMGRLGARRKKQRILAGAQTALKMVQAINAPIPLALEPDHATAIMAQLPAQGGIRGLIPLRGETGIRRRDAISRAQALCIAP